MKIPTINWSQNNNFIFIDIQLLPTEYEIKINETNITFKQDDYECNIKLYKNIDSKKSKYKTNRIFEFILKKKECLNIKAYIFGKNKKFFGKKFKGKLKYLYFKDLSYALKKILLDLKGILTVKLGLDVLEDLVQVIKMTLDYVLLIKLFS